MIARRSWLKSRPLRPWHGLVSSVVYAWLLVTLPLLLLIDHVDFSRLLDTAVGGTCGQVLSVAAELYGVRRSGMMALFDEDTHSYME